MIVLTAEPGEAEKLAGGGGGLQRRYGMPIDPAPLARPASCEPACRAVVAARLHAPAAEEPLLRRLRVRAMLGGLLDDPDMIATAGREAGLDPADVRAWSATAAVEEALQADMEAARSPTRPARALDHKLGWPPERRRYTAIAEAAEGLGRAPYESGGFTCEPTDAASGKTNYICTMGEAKLTFLYG